MNGALWDTIANVTVEDPTSKHPHRKGGPYGSSAKYRCVLTCVCVPAVFPLRSGIVNSANASARNCSPPKAPLGPPALARSSRNKVSQQSLLSGTLCMYVRPVNCDVDEAPDPHRGAGKNNGCNFWWPWPLATQQRLYTEASWIRRL